MAKLWVSTKNPAKVQYNTDKAALVVDTGIAKLDCVSLEITGPEGRKVFIHLTAEETDSLRKKLNEYNELFRKFKGG